jgi:peptidoglycan hydrolase-like protein with peptidoglycan-binding domain
MRKIAFALLATTLIGSPAIAASDNQQQPQNQQSQTQNQPQAQNKSNNQSAQNKQAISPESLSRADIRQVQQALQQNGFKSGRADGRWGPETENAVKQFQQSKQIEASGQLDQQTVADLGLDASKFSQSRNQQ